MDDEEELFDNEMPEQDMDDDHFAMDEIAGFEQFLNRAI